MRPIPTRERFKSRIKITAGCWAWQDSIDSIGYGMFNMHGVTSNAHRAAYELFIGEIPKGMCVLHRCDNPPCCNPKHLFLGTNQENTADRHKKGREARGESHGMSKLKEGEILTIRELYKQGCSQSELARRYDVKQPAIWRIVRNKTWRHI